MTPNRWIAISAAFALLAFPALSLADHHENDEEVVEDHDNMAGGKAAEHRSERAAERSNAQWDEGNEGRPERVREGDRAGDEDEAAAKDENAKREEKGAKDKKGKKDKSHKQKD